MCFMYQHLLFCVNRLFKGQTSCIGELWGSKFRVLDLILPAPKQNHTGPLCALEALKTLTKLFDLMKRYAKLPYYNLHIPRHTDMPRLPRPHNNSNRVCDKKRGLHLK